jgi:hypothetical protein
MESPKGSFEVDSTSDPNQKGFKTDKTKLQEPRRVGSTGSRGYRPDSRRSVSKAWQKGRRWEIKLRDSNGREVEENNLVAGTEDTDFEKISVGNVTEEEDLLQLSETENEYLDLLADMMLEKDLESLEGAATVARDLRWASVFVGARIC